MWKAFKADVVVGDLQQLRSGAKVAYLSANNEPIRLCLADVKSPLDSPWGICSFDESNDRKNLDLTCSDELCKFWGKVDEQIKDQLEKNSEHYFKKKLTRSQLDSIWKPTVLGREGYPPQFRTKLPVVDDKVSCYDFERNPVQLDRHAFKKASVVPIVHLKNVYFMGNNCGLVIDIHTMLVKTHEDDVMGMFDVPIV